MMAKDAFVRKWRCHLAGLALYGIAFEAKEGPLARAGRALDVPGEVERLLGMMYADLTAEEPKPTAGKTFADVVKGGNGHART